MDTSLAVRTLIIMGQKKNGECAECAVQTENEDTGAGVDWSTVQEVAFFTLVFFVSLYLSGCLHFVALELR